MAFISNTGVCASVFSAGCDLKAVFAISRRALHAADEACVASSTSILAPMAGPSTDFYSWIAYCIVMALAICAESSVAIVLTHSGFIFRPEPSDKESLVIVSDGRRPVRLHQ